MFPGEPFLIIATEIEAKVKPLESSKDCPNPVTLLKGTHTGRSPEPPIVISIPIVLPQ
jgi:hypothetical protein